MKNNLIRVAAFVLLLTMMVGLLPISALAVPSRDEPEDIWLAISELEDRAAAVRSVCTVEAREAAYVEIVDQIIDLVEHSEQYVPGSLERHGNFFFWMDVNGDPNGYSPSLRAKIRQNAIPGADPEACGATKTVSFADRGGYPGSVDVAAIQPYIGIDDSFTDQYENECYSIAQATGGTGTSYQASNATITNIGQAISTCGVVIFDSHGTTDYSGYNDNTSRANSSYLCLTSGTGITEADKSSATGDYGTYYHAFNSGGTWCVDGTAIANHLSTDSPNGLLWMAICLGMATDGLHAPLREKGVEVAYGYSQSVSFTGDYAYEACFFGDLKEGKTVSEGAAHMKQQVGIKDPYTNPPAYPIFVSSEDVYPGHGKVDKAQTVNSTWMMIGTDYEITAVSNNEEWGTVSVQGAAVTAVPNTGYYVDGYTLLSGTAEVTRNGNRFIVIPSSDCTVKINFAPKTPITVTFVANGAVYNTVPSYAGDPLNLPNSASEVENWTFKGWVLEPIEESLEKPTFLKPGASFTPTADTTVYALYVHVEAEGSGDTVFELLSDEPDDWEGNYVITYGTDSGMKILTGLSGSAVGTSVEVTANVSTLAQSGAALEDGVLLDVPDSVIFTMESRGEYYSLQSVSTEAYYGMTTYSLSAYSNYAATTCDWTPGVGADASCLESAVYSNYPYLSYNNSSYGGSYFWCYSTIDTSIRLWKQTVLGVKTYSTNPGNMVHTHSMQHYDAVQPTCGANGNTEYYRCVICGKFFSDASGDNEISQASTVIAATGEHVFGEWTASNNGTHKKTCSVCGASESEACSYEAVVSEPNCTEAGYTTYTCTVCNYSYQGANVPALGHDWGEWTQTEDPTCTQQGEKTRTCERCQTVETQSVDALGHSYNSVVTDPTCTDGGYTTYTCARCSDSYTDDATSPLGHAYGEWTVSVQPTCTGGGQEKRICSRCNSEETRDLDALGHAWDDGVVTKAPTDQEEGERLFTCERCGGTRTETIGKLEHPNPFVDVIYGSYYFDAVQWAYYHAPRITGGTDATHFSPNAPCTREQIVFFLWAAAGKPAPSATETAFTDVKPKQYFYDAVLWAQEQGITSGVSETRFGVGKYCTREQAVTFLWRAAGSPEPASRTNPFQDVPSNAYYAKAVRWAVENHITGGTGADTFSPKKICTRSQVVTFLYRHDMLFVR